MNSSHAVRTTAAALAVVAALCGSVPDRARANEFTINTCQADRRDFSTRAFEDFANRGMMWRRACNPEGPGLRGLMTANVVRAGRVVRGSRSYFMLKAPPGTQFTRFAWSGQARRHDCRYALQVWAARPNGTSVAIKNVRANRGCPNPGDTQGAGWPSARMYNIAGTTKIIQRVLCVGGKGKPYCSSRHLNYIRTFRAQAWVADTSAPLVGIQKDTPFTRGEWVNGTQRVNYVAADNVGVRSVRPVVAGHAVPDTQRPCNYAREIPCASGPGSVTVDTAQLTRRAPRDSCSRARMRPATSAISPDNGQDRPHRSGSRRRRNRRRRRLAQRERFQSRRGPTQSNRTEHRSSRATSGSARSERATVAPSVDSGETNAPVPRRCAWAG